MREHSRNNMKRYSKQIRQRVLDHYGRICACCGETREAFLAIDHVDNDGAEHRRKIGGGGNAIYLWLEKNGFPDRFQTLCQNCNWAKSRGGCPHIKERADMVDKFFGAVEMEAPFKNEYLSASRLKTYSRCARQFFYKYVRKVPKEFQVQDNESPAVFGNAIHTVLERIYDRAKKEKYVGPFPIDAITPEWSKSFSEWNLLKLSDYTEGLRILRDYAVRYRNINHETILGVEAPFSIEIGENFVLHGRIDRIDLVNDFDVEIVDYKSNRGFFSQEDLINDIQMSIYGIVIQHMFPWVQNISFVFSMVRLGTEQRTSRSTKTLEDVRNHVITLGKKIESDKEWRPTLNSWCQYCEFRVGCSTYQEAILTRSPKTANPNDLDAMAKEYAHVGYIANAAYARKKELETLLKAHVAMTFDAPVLNDKVWDLTVTPQTKYDVKKVTAIAREYGTPESEMARLFELLSVSKEAVEEWVASLEDVFRQVPGGASNWGVLKREIEVLGLKTIDPKVSLTSKKK
jgi:RecB family exonuclease